MHTFLNCVRDLTMQPDHSLCTFVGHSASVMSLDFHPNKGDLICSCDGINEIRYWSIKNGGCARVIKVKVIECLYIHSLQTVYNKSLSILECFLELSILCFPNCSGWFSQSEVSTYSRKIYCSCCRKWDIDNGCRDCSNLWKSIKGALLP